MVDIINYLWYYIYEDKERAVMEKEYEVKFNYYSKHSKSNKVEKSETFYFVSNDKEISSVALEYANRLDNEEYYVLPNTIKEI